MKPQRMQANPSDLSWGLYHAVEHDEDESCGKGVPCKPVPTDAPNVDGKLMNKAPHGEFLRKTRGTYAYCDGDWTYEELTAMRNELLAEKYLVWGALGFEATHLTTAEKVAERAMQLRGHWLRVLWQRVFA